MGDGDGWQGPRRHDEGEFGRLINLLSDHERRLAAVERGDPLNAAGIGVDENGMVVDSSLTILGTLYVNRDDVPDLPGYLRAYLEASSGRTAMKLVPPRQDESSETHIQIEGATPGSPGLASVVAGGQARLIAGGSAFVIAGATAFIQAVDDVSIEAQGNAYVTGAVVGFRSPRSGGGWAVDVHSNGEKFNAAADNGFTIETSTSSHRIRSVGDDVGIDAPNRLYVGANVHATGNLSCGGTKPFVIDHPLHPDKSLVHVATETPVASIEYPWPEPVTLDENGEAELVLPDYFEALAADDYRAVWVQPVGRPFATGAGLVVDGRTTVYGEPGRQVFVKISARRGDAAGQFEVEIPRIQPPVETEEAS